MTGNPKIDERDIDKLLSALSDRQIASLFELRETEVAKIRRDRREQSVKQQCSAYDLRTSATKL